MKQEELADAYRRYGHLVLRRCQRILRDDAAAEDALQETFVRLWRFGDSFLVAESKLSWLYRVAERCCFDLLSKRSGRREEPLDEAAPAPASATTPGAAGALEDREVVMRLLDRFDDRVRQVAVLHYLDEMSHEEIAAATGWSRPTVAKKLEYVRTRAAALRQQLYGGPPA